MREPAWKPVTASKYNTFFILGIACLYKIDNVLQSYITASEIHAPKQESCQFLQQVCSLQRQVAFLINYTINPDADLID